MRVMWKGHLKFSLVTIPVRMYHAISAKAIAFNTLHEACHTRVKQNIYCPECNKPVSNEETVKGYQYGKDMYVVMSDEDFQKAKKESTDAIEVMAFVEDSQIDPVYYCDSHYLVPEKIGEEAFAILMKAMAGTKKTAVAHMVMRNKEYLFAIRPQEDHLVAYTLHYPSEINDISSLDETKRLAELQVSDKPVKMAAELIEQMSKPFVPGEYKDEYAETLLEVIKSRVEGKEVIVHREAERTKVVNLMDALEKSLEAAKMSKATRELSSEEKGREKRRKKAQ